MWRSEIPFGIRREEKMRTGVKRYWLAIVLTLVAVFAVVFFGLQCDPKVNAAEIPTDFWPQGGETGLTAANWSVSEDNELVYDGQGKGTIATTFGTPGSYSDVTISFEVVPGNGAFEFGFIIGPGNFIGWGQLGAYIYFNQYGVWVVKDGNYADQTILGWVEAGHYTLAANGRNSVQICIQNSIAEVMINGNKLPYTCDIVGFTDTQSQFAAFLGTSGTVFSNLRFERGDSVKHYFNQGITYYISSTEGNNENTGESIYSPWGNFDKIEQLILSPGDKILLKRGDVFTDRLVVCGTGTEDAEIYIGAYGNANEKPIISLDNNEDDIAVLVSDWQPNSQTRVNINYITIENLCIKNTRLGIYYRVFTGTENKGFTVKNTEFYNITCDSVLERVMNVKNAGGDVNAAISAEVLKAKGNLPVLNGTGGGVNEYIFPAAIFVGGVTGPMSVSGPHATYLDGWIVENCKFDNVTTGIMSWFYYPHTAGNSSEVWRNIVRNICFADCSFTGIVNGAVALDGVNGGAVTSDSAQQANSQGYGIISNLRVTQGCNREGVSWPNGTTGAILNNTQDLLLTDCTFSGIINQGNPDGCGIDFESNCERITLQNSILSDNEGQGVLLMNGGNYGGNKQITIRNNLFANNLTHQSDPYRYELMFSAAYDGHQNISVYGNFFFLNEKNLSDSDILLIDETLAYVTLYDNTIYRLDPEADIVTVVFCGNEYSFHARPD